MGHAINQAHGSDKGMRDEHGELTIAEYVSSRLQEGVSKEELIQEFMDAGWAQAEAESLVAIVAAELLAGSARASASMGEEEALVTDEGERRMERELLTTTQHPPRQSAALEATQGAATELQLEEPNEAAFTCRVLGDEDGACAQLSRAERQQVATLLKGMLDAARKWHGILRGAEAGYDEMRRALAGARFKRRRKKVISPLLLLGPVGGAAAAAAFVPLALFGPTFAGAAATVAIGVLGGSLSSGVVGAIMARRRRSPVPPNVLKRITQLSLVGEQLRTFRGASTATVRTFATKIQELNVQRSKGAASTARSTGVGPGTTTRGRLDKIKEDLDALALQLETLDIPEPAALPAPAKTTSWHFPGPYGSLVPRGFEGLSAQLKQRLQQLQAQVARQLGETPSSPAPGPSATGGPQAGQCWPQVDQCLKSALQELERLRRAYVPYARRLWNEYRKAYTTYVRALRDS